MVQRSYTKPPRGTKRAIGGPIVSSSVKKFLESLPENKLPVVLDFTEFLKSTKAVRGETPKAAIGGPILKAVLKNIADLPADKRQELIDSSKSLMNMAIGGPIITAMVDSPLKKKT